MLREQRGKPSKSNLSSANFSKNFSVIDRGLKARRGICGEESQGGFAMHDSARRHTISCTILCFGF